MHGKNKDNKTIKQSNLWKVIIKGQSIKKKLGRHVSIPKFDIFPSRSLTIPPEFEP